MTTTLLQRPWFQPILLMLAPGWSLAALLAALLFAVDARSVLALASAVLGLTGASLAAWLVWPMTTRRVVVAALPPALLYLVLAIQVVQVVVARAKGFGGSGGALVILEVVTAALVLLGLLVYLVRWLQGHGAHVAAVATWGVALPLALMAVACSIAGFI